MTTTRLPTLRRLLREVPGSLRALSLDAGVHVSLIYRILDGKKRLTPATACALVDVLDDWTARCQRAADALRDVCAERTDS